MGPVSSGCIYSGRRPDGVGWSEEDEPNFSFRNPPCSFYGGTKALGEEILQGAENCYIWRLRIPFNEEKSPRNYLQKLLNYDSLLEAENSVSHLEEFVQKCVECFEKGVQPGIYNMTNPGSVTTCQVTEWMREERVTDKQFQFFEDEDHFMSKVAKTPRSNCVLDTTKAEKAGISMRLVAEAMRESIKKMAQRTSV
jgi:dTDP-4-dehydrorhamnose reductase